MMLSDVVLVALIALGHFSLMIAALNRGHALAFSRHRWMEPIAALAMITLGLLSLAGFAAMLRQGSAAWPTAVWIYAGACLAVSVGLLPARAAARGLRGTPAGIRGRSDAIDLARNHGRDALVGSGRLGLALRLPGNDSLRLERSEWSVRLPGLPAHLDGLSVLHLSDLHFSRAYDPRFFEAVADEAAALETDLVLFTGDLLDDDACLPWIEPVLGRLRGRLANYAILGNHDLHHHPERVAAEVERAGFRVLDGTWDRLDVNGLSLAIGGTFAPWGPPLDAGPHDAALRVVLSHSPDRIYELSRRGVDLVFSGHNHGGQARLPVLGPVLMPSLYGRRFEDGFFRVGRTLLHVSRGVGAKHPIRFRCPPEISRIVLRAAVVNPHVPHSGIVGRERVR